MSLSGLRKEKKQNLHLMSIHIQTDCSKVHKSSRIGGLTILPERDLISEDGGLAKLGVYAFL